MPPSPSLAREYFEKITAPQNGYAYLSRYDEIAIAEHEWLEIKGAAEIKDPAAREIWSKVMSAYANVGGGVLIWGLNFKKVEGVDRPLGLSLHPDAEKFAAYLKEHTPEAVNPPLVGVDVVSLLKPGSKKGFVVCYVPEGTAKPHRAEFAGRNYYLRIQDRTVIPEPQLLRTLFHPRSSASLQPSILRGHDTPDGSVTFWLCLKNRGAITARNVSAFLSTGLKMKFDIIGSDQVLFPENQWEHIPIVFKRGINPQMDANAFMGIRLGSPEFIRDSGFRMMMKLSWEDAPAALWSRLITFDDCHRTMRLEWQYEGQVEGP